MYKDIILIAHNLRSTHNVGSLLRTAEGIGVSKVFLTGYTPYPILDEDTRLPYIRERIEKKINKTALGANEYIKWEHAENIFVLLEKLKIEGYELVGLEQTNKAIDLKNFISNNKIALLVGREVEGIEEDVLSKMSIIVNIPMLGQKESFNVVQAAAMALYKIRFIK